MNSKQYVKRKKSIETFLIWTFLFIKFEFDTKQKKKGRDDRESHQPTLFLAFHFFLGGFLVYLRQLQGPVSANQADKEINNQLNEEAKSIEIMGVREAFMSNIYSRIWCRVSQSKRCHWQCFSHTSNFVKIFYLLVPWNKQ